MEIPCSIKLGKLLVFPISTKAEKPVREPSRLVRRWNHRRLSRPYWEVQSCEISRKINRFKLWVTLLEQRHKKKKQNLGRVHVQSFLSPTRKPLMRKTLTNPMKPEYKKSCWMQPAQGGSWQSSRSLFREDKIQVRNIILFFSFLEI